jgi:hypothetical protein
VKNIAIRFIGPALIVSSLLAPAVQAVDLFWNQYVVQATSFGSWQPFIEIQPRWNGPTDTRQALILRGAVRYEIFPHFVGGIGFAQIDQYAPTLRGEERVFEQFDFAPEKALEGALAHSYRLRIEQRFLEGAPDTAHRVRARAHVAWMPGKCGIYAWDEVFFNLNDAATVTNSGFDQNRFSIGPRLRFDNLAIEAGYLLQTLNPLIGAMQRNPGGILNFVVSI